MTNLRKALRNRPALLGDGVSRAFLRALVQLTAGYREALTLQQRERITFDPNKFVESRPLSMQPFLRKMLELQIFQQVSRNYQLKINCLTSDLENHNNLKCLVYRRETTHVEFWVGILGRV